MELTIRLIILAICTIIINAGAVFADSSGGFSLRANQVTALNAFVPLRWLQGEIERDGFANILLVSGASGHVPTLEKAEEALNKKLELADIGLAEVEGAQIAALRPTREDITLFVAEHPHYARHYWRNIRLSYLEAGEGPLTPEQLAPFLQAALFNAEAAYDSEN